MLDLIRCDPTSTVTTHGVGCDPGKSTIEWFILGDSNIRVTNRNVVIYQKHIVKKLKSVLVVSNN